MPAMTSPSSPPANTRWDIFCRVIDNFGDIGVCWRLARQLHAEYGFPLRLWLDAPQALMSLCPAYNGEDKHGIGGIEIRHWTNDFPNTDAADVIIEAFACDLPASYLDAMRSRQQASLWINLEYLSAEAWIEDCHGLASPQAPGLPPKYFFFPGFTPRSGGLICESTEQQRLLPPPLTTLPEPLTASLFCYDNAPVGPLFDSWQRDRHPLRCLIAPGKPTVAAERHLQQFLPAQLGALQLLPTDFCPQSDYDTFLQGCDLNFIRGEDSFIRAIWAGKPFVWQLYPQDEGAHLDKLDAFLAHYLYAAEPLLAESLRVLFFAWNGQTDRDIGMAWQTCRTQWPQWCQHAHDWAKTLKNQPDLASRLTQFVAARL